jgi:hypothetical protein
VKILLRTRLKSFISGTRSCNPNLEAVETACFLERSLAHVRLTGEPELPKGYRHIHSAIGALLTVGQEYYC